MTPPPSQRKKRGQDVSRSASTPKLSKAIVLDKRGNIPSAAFSRTGSEERGSVKLGTRKRKERGFDIADQTDDEEEEEEEEGEEEILSDKPEVENDDQTESETDEVKQNTLSVSTSPLARCIDVRLARLQPAKPVSKRRKTLPIYSTERSRSRIDWDSKGPEDQSPTALKRLRRCLVVGDGKGGEGGLGERVGEGGVDESEERKARERRAREKSEKVR